MNILIIDNYDSFTFNLYQYVGEILQSRQQPFALEVVRNDRITRKEIERKRYDRIIISPGPGDPSDPAYFGVCADVLVTIGKTIPVLGVCLGMQGMAHYFGGRVIKAYVPMHGKTSTIVHDGQGIFTGLPQQLSVMRYHSLVADPTAIPSSLNVTALVDYRTVPVQHNLDLNPDNDQSVVQLLQQGGMVEIMGLRHVQYPIEGIQFHPESFATEGGNMMLKNFLYHSL